MLSTTGQDTIGPGPGYIGPDGNRGYPPGSVLPKTPPGPDAYGAVDEAVSMLGLARAEAEFERKFRARYGDAI